MKVYLGPALLERIDCRTPDWERSFLGCPIPQSRGVDSSCPDTGASPSFWNVGV